VPGAGHADGRAFLRRTGFDDALVLRGSALDLQAVDRSLVAAWSAALDERYQVDVHVGPLPDDAMPAFLEADAAMNDAPRDGLDLADVPPDPRRLRYWEAITWACAGRRICALAVDRETGEGAGFSNVWWEPDRHTVVWQGGTGVAAAHRGHGLGRVLKARVLEHLADLAPDATEIRTDNAHSNPWMLRINDDLGFTPYGDLIEWQVKL
jgi:mycothiol synthase